MRKSGRKSKQKRPQKRLKPGKNIVKSRETPLKDDESSGFGAVSLQQMANLLLITKKRIQQHIAAGEMPGPNAEGRFDVLASFQARLRYLQSQYVPGGGSGSEGYTEQRIRLTRSKADIAELDRARLTGDLLPRNLVIAEETARRLNARTRLLAIPAKMAAQVLSCKDAAEAQELLRREISDALDELSKGRKYDDRSAA